MKLDANLRERDRSRDIGHDDDVLGELQWKRDRVGHVNRERVETTMAPVESWLRFPLTSHDRMEPPVSRTPDEVASG
ncbi:MAG: hypothetical protein ACREQY_01995 [Candidatus Binatia bacterium]